METQAVPHGTTLHDMYIVVVSLCGLLFDLFSSICHYPIPSVKLTMCIHGHNMSQPILLLLRSVSIRSIRKTSSNM